MYRIPLATRGPLEVRAARSDSPKRQSALPVCSTSIANMLFRVDTASTTSLADQIALQVRAGIVHGALAPGERLPPARELAAALQVNMHTVLRAYGQLRDEGVIQMRRGRGAWVSEDAGAGLIRVQGMVEQLMVEARKHGLSAIDVTRLVERA